MIFNSTYDAPTPEPTAQDTVWHQLSRILIFMIVIIILVGGTVLFLPEIKRQKGLEERLAQVEADLEREKLLNHDLNNETQWVQNDPVYVSMIARDKLDLMGENEIVFRFEESTSATPSESLPTNPAKP